jgi:rubrerythrin
MKTSTDIGMNRTGLSTAPLLSKQMIRSSHDALAAPAPDGEDARATRLAYAKDAPPIGTVPPPVSLKGVATAAAKGLQGDKAGVLVDKLGERLAFERMGVRLYEALLLKLDAAGKTPSGPSRRELEEIHADERRHFALVHHSIESLGGDPTVQTPSADLEGVASLGLVQILSDPRTSVREGLQAILHAEAADRDGWELLIALAEGFGQTEMAQEFEKALQTEETHLIRVRGWAAALTHQEALGEAPATTTTRAARPAASAPGHRAKAVRGRGRAKAKSTRARRA